MEFQTCIKHAKSTTNFTTNFINLKIILSYRIFIYRTNRNLSLNEMTEKSMYEMINVSQRTGDVVNVAKTSTMTYNYVHSSKHCSNV